MNCATTNTIYMYWRNKLLKAALSINLICILLLMTGCELFGIKRPEELGELFDKIPKQDGEVELGDGKRLPGVKIDTPPVIDGKLTDEAWRNAPQGTDFFDRNAGNIQAQDQTTIMLVYSDEAIYLAWYLFDSVPDGIVGLQAMDQIRPSGEDWVSFTIDPFHTHQFMDRIFFMANPLGSKWVSHPPPFATPEELSDMWDVAASIVDDGWIVEMEIPWTMLHYPDTDKPINIGINFDRGHARTRANTWWSKVRFVEDNRQDGHWMNVKPPLK